MAIPDEWKEKFIAQIELWQNDETQERQRHVDRIKAELAALKSKVDRLNTAFTAGGLELGEFKELKNPLIVQTAVLEQQLTKALKNPLIHWLKPQSRRNSPRPKPSVIQYGGGGGN